MFLTWGLGETPLDNLFPSITHLIPKLSSDTHMSNEHQQSFLLTYADLFFNFCQSNGSSVNKDIDGFLVRRFSLERRIFQIVNWLKISFHSSYRPKTKETFVRVPSIFTLPSSISSPIILELETILCVLSVIEQIGFINILLPEVIRHRNIPDITWKLPGISTHYGFFYTNRFRLRRKLNSIEHERSS